MTKRADSAEIGAIKKAVDFSQAKLDQLRDGDILNIKDDFWDLAGRGCAYQYANKEEFLTKLDLPRLKMIQGYFTEIFTTLADGGTEIGWSTEPGREEHDAENRKTIYFSAIANSKTEPFHFGVFSREPVELCTIALIMMIIYSGAAPEQFRRCPECKTLFFLGRKPDERNFYCKQACAVRAAVRNSRKGKTKTKRRAKK